jgi:hypothetical protein
MKVGIGIVVIVEIIVCEVKAVKKDRKNIKSGGGRA